MAVVYKTRFLTRSCDIYEKMVVNVVIKGALVADGGVIADSVPITSLPLIFLQY